MHAIFIASFEFFLDVWFKFIDEQVMNCESHAIFSRWYVLVTFLQLEILLNFYV